MSSSSVGAILYGFRVLGKKMFQELLSGWSKTNDECKEGFIVE